MSTYYYLRTRVTPGKAVPHDPVTIGGPYTSMPALARGVVRAAKRGHLPAHQMARKLVNGQWQPLRDSESEALHEMIDWAAVTRLPRR